MKDLDDLKKLPMIQENTDSEHEKEEEDPYCLY
jgi:hypothetical protein